MALFRRNRTEEPTPSAVDPVGEHTVGPAKKGRPTPSRREAEAARRQRVTRTLSKKESRIEASRQARGDRLRSMSARESIPEKALLRDYIDARFSLGELLLPSLAVILVLSFVSQGSNLVTLVSTALMYGFIIGVILDATVIKWRGFKKVLAERLPGTPTKGLLMYAMNRCIQIRRFRMPPPRIKRGEAY